MNSEGRIYKIIANRFDTVVLNPFYATGVSQYAPTPPENVKKPGFLMFSRVIEKNQWHEMGN